MTGKPSLVSARDTARLLFQAIRKSAEDHAKDLAAAIAYWSFFSIFPLLIAILSVPGYLLGSSWLGRPATLM